MGVLAQVGCLSFFRFYLFSFLPEEIFTVSGGFGYLFLFRYCLAVIILDLEDIVLINHTGNRRLLFQYRFKLLILLNHQKHLLYQPHIALIVDHSTMQEIVFVPLVEPNFKAKINRSFDGIQQLVLLRNYSIRMT